MRNSIVSLIMAVLLADAKFLTATTIQRVIIAFAFYWLFLFFNFYLEYKEEQKKEFTEHLNKACNTKIKESA